MESAISDVNELNLTDIPERCSRCLYWSLPAETETMKPPRSPMAEELTAKKRRWILHTMREFGNCGKILYHNTVPVGYAEYAPSGRFPQIEKYRSQPIGTLDEGVVFLSCLHIVEQHLRGKGLGTQLLSTVITDLRRRGFKAVETYARAGSPNNPSGPVELYLNRGFYVKDDTNPEFPIVRLDLSTRVQ